MSSENTYYRIVEPTRMSLTFMLFIEDEIRKGGGSVFVDMNEARAKLVAVFNTLTGKERYVIWERFGFGLDESKTLTQVAKTYKVTRERIREIEKRAMRRMAISLDPTILAGEDFETSSVDLE